MQDIRLEKCLFGRREVDIPEMLIEDVDLFTQIFTQEAWETVLNEPQRKHLMSLLPNFPAAVDHVEKQQTLRLLFSGNTFKFGSPVKQFYKKMRDGAFVPDIAKYAALCSHAKDREYRYQQKVYYSGLLREILINRHRILEALHHLPPEETVKFDSICWNESSLLEKSHVDYRVFHKCHQLMREVNEDCGQTAGSSDDEEDDGEDLGCQILPKNHLKVQLGRTQESKLTTAPVQDTFAPRPTFDLTSSDSFLHGTSQSGLKQKRPHRRMMMPDISRDSYKAMLYKHKRRKLEYSDHPELNTSELTLEDVIARVHTAKKTKSVGIHHKKTRKPVPLESEVDVTQCDKELKLLQIESSSLQTMKKETDDANVKLTAPPIRRYNVYPHFFCLLKEFICEEPEEKIMTSKVEEKIRDWQNSDLAAANYWCSDRNWVDLVPSALRFLSGDLFGLSVDNFVPILDFKERLQQWRWIGHGRDSDEELGVLCDFWSMNHQNEMADSTSLVPPPRMWTDYKVKPTTEEEKQFFQAQERERFGNPHKAFTYHMHGYEAVVGPVKGVFAKENSIRPRDHALLVKDRPSYVTILTLVHDGAARLPNGEGTRADICELLKESQFLAPGVTDAQINAVVSGALDRLHYEKDPCVKYDGARKVWIYRHRSRAEDEFERIHQAQCVAAKAKKKALQKSKPLKTGTVRFKEKGAEPEKCDASSLTTLSQSLVRSVDTVMNDDYLLTQPLDVSIPFTSTTAKSMTVTCQPPAELPLSILSVAAGPKACTLQSSCKVADTPKATTCSKGKPLTVSLIQQEKHLKLPSVAPHVHHSNQLPALNLLQSQLSKTSNSITARPVLVTTSSAWPRTVLQPLPSPGLRLPPDSVSSASPTIFTSSKSVASHIVRSSTPDLRQQLPGVLALPGTVVRSIGIKPAMLVTSSCFTISSLSHPESAAFSSTENSETGVIKMSKGPVTPALTVAVSGHLRPIIIGGKPQSTMAGRSVQFMGKPMQLIQSINCTTQPSQISTSALSVGSSAPVVIRTKLTSSPSLVSQILHQQSLSSSGFPQRLVKVSTTEQSHAGSVVPSHFRVGNAAQMKLVGSIGPTRLVLPADQSGIVITQLPSQAGAHGSVLGTASKPNPSIQLMRALTSLSADKNKHSSPTTFLLATQHVASTSESIKLQFAAANATAASAKPNPVFARCIINPATGLRLSSVVPNQLNTTLRPPVCVTTCCSLPSTTSTSVSHVDVTKPPN